MTDLTDRTLKHWRSTAHKWGVSDCLLSLADHVLDATGCDYGLPWRGRYTTEAEALGFVAASGGAARMIDTSGLPRTASPDRGDIVLAECQGALVGGICTGAGIAFRRPRGVIEVNKRFITIVSAWKVPQ